MYYQFWNSKEIPYIKSITFITFAVNWEGDVCVIATDYDSYAIWKVCDNLSNERKYLFVNVLK
jgi:hypothetical protein